ncbi:MAG: superoxide dismutase [Candidatus Marinimicrobia bacterium]|jgi:nickel superoxide dismutase|nr:superoxide dismutase [Candidatus Neomarinimicrobiota bacterium]MBT3630151.1 superoxide dismutase [Candidatus Neomarinimicrobiota bacterium]MBT3826103.1 superoxide dismutase [Candidatus Neomarinimicrobiota bacterium]MBT4132137.1 superoxide dismutase [Candidatus Neomarinimicrobiota bacterium]MBT4296624.1 superoxide dismutase [Candidatus Neomarinimicrobiota bacterium]
MKHIYRTTFLSLAILFSVGLILPQSAQAHCQIPCGIYDDYARLQFMLEDAATVEKSVKTMIKLTGKTDIQSQNQMVRWVMNKEDHAQKIIDTISDYFLTQRIMPSQKDYSERLKHHHAVILAAMKAKQNADLASVKTLKKSISLLAQYYPEHKH